MKSENKSSPLSIVWSQGRVWGVYESVDANGPVYVIDGGEGDDSIMGDGTILTGYYQTLAETLNGNDVMDGGAGDDWNNEKWRLAA